MSYRVQSPDTSYEIEQVQVALFRRRGEAGRGDLMRSLIQATRWPSFQNVLKLNPDLSRQEAALRFIELNYGNELAQGVRADLSRRKLRGQPFSEEKLFSNEEILAALTPVVDAFEALGIDYLIGGSVASSIHGIVRATADADVVADFRPEHVAPFIARIEADYYVSETAVQDAFTRQASFNVVHLETGFKLDIFVLNTDQFNQTGFRRSRLVQLSRSVERLFRLDSPEDILLKKLNWYRAGGEVSEKQWLDVLGVLKMQQTLDFPYLKEWAAKLGLTDLLERAFDEAGRS